MRLKRHATEVVLVALAVVAGVWWVLDTGRVTDVERKEREHDVFPAYRRGDVDALELVQGATKLRLEKRLDTGDAGETYWQIVSPVKERADPAAVDRLIGDLEFAGAIRKVSAPAGGDVSLGLDAPRVRGTLAMKSLVYRFALGGPAPLPEGAAYFRVEGEGTYVVSKDFATALLAMPDTFRERTIVPYLSLDLASLEVTSAGVGFTVTRVDDVAFKLGGSGLRASRDGMDRVWGALAEARAEAFLPDDEADRALGTDAVRVRMTPKDARKPAGELRLGGVCPGHPDDVVLVRISPTRASACVPKGALPGLRTPADALVDRRLFLARADEVEEITLETVPPRFTVELARKGHGWHERRPVDRELEGTEIDAANDLVTRLSRGEASAVRPGGDAGAFAARARVHLKRGGSDATEVVELGPGTVLARRAFDGAWLDVPSAVGRLLWPSEIALRGRTVFHDLPAGAMPTAVVTECDGLRQSLTREADAWILREPRGFAADSRVTADLVALVRNAQAEAWVAEDDDGTFGFGDNACRMTFEYKGDAGTRSFGLVFGKPAEPGAFYAHATGDRAVFLAPHALREGASTLFIDRGGFRSDPDSVASVTLSRGAAHAVFAGRRGRGAVDAAAQDTASKILAALDVLRPDTVVHLGPPRPNEGFAPPVLDVRVKTATDAGEREIHVLLGDTALVGRDRIVYARLASVDATFGFSPEKISALVQAL